MIGKSKQFTIINTQTTTSHLNSLNTKITTALRYSVGNPDFGLREPHCFYWGGDRLPVTGMSIPLLRIGSFQRKYRYQQSIKKKTFTDSLSL